MKTLSVPRLDSLLHRLQRAPKGEDSSYLDQLMIFLDDPPPGIRDRWKEGARMCADWGFPSTGASVWRLYRSYVLEWRIRLDLEARNAVTVSPRAIEKKITQMVALRAFEVLANPQSPPACLVSLARIELRKQALEFARQKHRDHQTGEIELALAALEKKARYNWDASFALGQLNKALQQKNPRPSPLLAPLQAIFAPSTPPPPPPTSAA